MSVARISQEEVSNLQRWARVALATRCVRRARTLLPANTEPVRILDGVLAELDRATDTGSAGEALADVAASAYTLALNNIDSHGPVDHDAVIATCMVAHSAAFAAEAAMMSDAYQAAHLVAQSIDFAIHAYRMADPVGADAAVAAMRADLEILRNEAGSWSDEMPVPEGFFGGL